MHRRYPAELKAGAWDMGYGDPIQWTLCVFTPAWRSVISHVCVGWADTCFFLFALFLARR